MLYALEVLLSMRERNKREQKRRHYKRGPLSPYHHPRRLVSPSSPLYLLPQRTPVHYRRPSSLPLIAAEAVAEGGGLLP